MRNDDSAIALHRVTGGRVTGLALGAVAVVAFSLSLPATRVAVEAFGPWFVAFGRAVGAGALAAAYLRLTKAAAPTREQWRRLAIVAGGVVFGFPVFTSLALVTQTAAHGAVVIAVLPAVTAGFAVLRAGERPPPQFWLAGGAGLVAVLAFLAASGAVSGAAGPADLFLLVAVVCCGLGYAEGGRLARDLGGAATIAWAVVLALPVTVPVTAVAVALDPPRGDGHAWLGFGYVTVVSMFAAFVAWYAGLARGGVARISQLQLAQPALSLGWSAWLVHEPVGPLAIGTAVAVMACVAWTQRVRGARIASAVPPAVVGSGR